MPASGAEVRAPADPQRNLGRALNAEAWRNFEHDNRERISESI